MALAPTDRRELVEPLFAGLTQRPPWQSFLARLLARTAAERGAILVRGPGGSGVDSRVEAFARPELVRRAGQTLASETALPGLRPMRVYSLGELLELYGEDERARRGAALNAMGTAYGRAMLVPGPAGWNTWLVIEHSRHDFTVADTALLSDLGPYLATALELLLELDRLHRRAEIAEQALAALGVSQALLDRDRRVVIGHNPNGDRLLRPAPAEEALVDLPGATVALTRAAPPAGAAEAAQVLAERHGLSRREAELALALSDGAELVPAGLALGLTAETTRNYSKRIYAKTGARGQADLVRLVLTGLAPFAAAGEPERARPFAAA